MAGYRPKSLSELNDMYDKTITAEKAIIKATKQLHDEADKIAPLEISQEEMPKEETKVIEELSDEVDSLINRFKEETQLNAPKVKEPPTVKEPDPVLVPSQPEEIKEEVKPAAESIPQPAEVIRTADPAPVRAKAHFSLDTTDDLQKKAAAKSDERTDLFDDYMKIMNDEDDDVFSSRESFRKKDKKKKHKKGLFFRHEPREEEPAEEAIPEEIPSEEPTVTAEAPAEAPSSDDLPVKEVIYTPEVPFSSDALKVEFRDAEPSEEEEIAGFVDDSLYTEDKETNPSPVYTLDETEDEKEEVLPQHPDFDIGEEKESDSPVVPDEIADKTYEDILNDSDDIYSFDPNKLSTLPEYAKDRYVPEEDLEYDDGEEDEVAYEHEETEEVFVMPKNKKGVVAGRVILSLLLTVICIFTVALVGINSILGVNTGNTAFGDKYIFTASQDYTNSNILEGDLIITEKRYANDGEVFAYINYTQQCFMFGKRNGSIVNDSGDVLFIAENDGERVLVLRDDTRGVVINTYPSVGKILSICTENFILLAAILLALGLVIVLLLAFVFKDKEKAYKKMMKKMIKKGVISKEEEADYEYSEEEAEPENLFSTIE